MWFLWRWSLQRGPLNKSPRRCKKKHYYSSFIKPDLLSGPLIPIIFIKSYTRSIIFVTFCQKLSNSWIYLWTNFLEAHWRCLQNIALQNPKKTPHFSKICPRELSFHIIHIYKKDTLGLLILRQLIENWSFPKLI